MCSDGPLLERLWRARLAPRGGGRPGRDGDLHSLAILAGEAGEQGLDQARQDDIQAAGLRARLRASVEQGLVSAFPADVEIDLAVIFDIGVDAVAIPERVVPPVVEG